MTAQGRHRIPIQRSRTAATQVNAFGVHVRSLTPRSSQTRRRLVVTLRIGWSDAEPPCAPHPAPSTAEPSASADANLGSGSPRWSCCPRTWLCPRAASVRCCGKRSGGLLKSCGGLGFAALSGITWKGISSFTASTRISIRTSCGALSDRQTSAKTTKPVEGPNGYTHESPVKLHLGEMCPCGTNPWLCHRCCHRALRFKSPSAPHSPGRPRGAAASTRYLRLAS